jgi:recombination protein RecA
MAKKTKVKKVEESTDKKSVKAVINALNKQFGFTALNYADKIEERPRLMFKQKTLNELTGGGVPAGQFTTIWGSSGSGKTSIVLELIAEAQKEGKVCVYCDLEHSYNPTWAKARGVDTTKLIYGDFRNAEQPMDAIIAFCQAQVADLIVIDSIHGLSPKSEQQEKGGTERSVENDSMALLARKLSQFFRMAAGFVSSANTAVVLIGQTRLDLGSFVKLETLSGGHALMHWNSLIIHLRRGQKADAPTAIHIDSEGKKEKVIAGFNCVIKTTKSKITGCIEGSEVSLPFYKEHGLKDAPIEGLTITEKEKEEVKDAE